ncbi:MAG: zinc ribbon domain-containing protein [Planctomycetes bacterium]|nr:zinc ribbon domain-containing protein [Planctomycetota bacterium]
MPTYDYVCDACDHRFELFHSIRDEPKKKCPNCGKNKLRRLIGTGAAIVFKGSGFYQTDYRSDSYRKAAEADKPASSTNSAESKSEAKTEAKSEPKPAKGESAAPGKKKHKPKN